MMVVLQVAVLAGVLVTARHTLADSSSGRLLMASVIVRHGDRSPMEPCPSDPLKTRMKQQFGSWATLTQAGEQQQRQLGEWLRERYSAVTAADQVLVTSSDTERTTRSARCLLEGLAPLCPDIPVATTPRHLDQMVWPKRQCKAYRQQLEALERSSFIQCVGGLTAALFKKLTQYCEAPVRKLRDVSYLYDVFQVQDQHNITLPDWSRVMYPDTLKDEVIYSFFVLPILTTRMQRIKSGPLLADMLRHMKSAATGRLRPAGRRLFIYSGHDITIAYLQQALGVYRPHWVPFAAAMMVELHARTPQDHTITIWYRNTTDHAPYLLRLPGCDDACPLDMFSQLTANVTLTNDWDTECSTNAWDVDNDDIDRYFNTGRGLPEEWKVCLPGQSDSNNL